MKPKKSYQNHFSGYRVSQDLPEQVDHNAADSVYRKRKQRLGV